MAKQVNAHSFRPDRAEEYEPAKRELDERGREVTAFLRACLRWAKDDPDAALAVLAPHWPPRRPRGAAAHVRRTEDTQKAPRDGGNATRTEEP